MATNGGSINYTVKYNIDKTGLNQMKASLQEIFNLSKQDLIKINSKATDADLAKLKASAKEVESALERAFNPNLGTLNVSKFNQELKKLDVKRIYQDFNIMGQAGRNAFRNITSDVLTTNMQLKQTHSILDNMATTMANTIKWGVASSIMNSFTGSVQQAYGYVKNLDGSLNDIRIVTGKSADEMAKFAVQANKAAKELGASTTSYTDASLIYYQQGLTDAEVAARAEVTLKAANVTGQSADAVSEQLTAVWNGYKVSAEEAELYIDKLAAVAATTASDLEELSVGMSKVASAANLMGVDVDQLNAQLATIVAVTRQAPESVGTALKTIYARMGDIEAGLDGETTLGNYTEKMAEMGYNVLDANGKLRDMGEVIEEIGGNWKNMSREQQISLSQTMAGTRQYNNLLSLFDNWDMYTKALETSGDAAGTLQEQQDIYMDRTVAHLQQLRTATEDLYDSLFETKSFNKLLDGITGAVNLLGNFVDAIGGGGNVLLALGSIGTKVFSKQLASGIATFITNMQTAKDNASQLRAELEILNQYEGANINDERTKVLVDMKRQILDLNKNITIEERNIANEYIKQQNELFKQQDALEARKKAAEETYKATIDPTSKLSVNNSNDAEKMARELEFSAKEFESSKMNEGTIQGSAEAYKELTQSIRTYLDVANGQKKVNKDLATAEAELIQAANQHQKTIEQQLASAEMVIASDEIEEKNKKELKIALEELDKLRNKDGSLNLKNIRVVKQLQVVEQERVKAYQKQANAMRQAANETRGFADATKKAKEETEQLQNSYSSFISQLNLRDKIQQGIQLASSFGQVASAISSIGRIPDIWENNDLSTGEKWLQTITNLGFALPMLANSLGMIGKTLGITTALTNAATAAKEAYQLKNVQLLGTEVRLNTAKRVGISTETAYKMALMGSNLTMAQRQEINKIYTLVLAKKMTAEEADIAIQKLLAGQNIKTAFTFETAAAAAKKFFATLGPIGWAVLGLTAAFAGFKVFDYFNTSAKEAGEALTESISSYKELENELSSLESQLSTTKDRLYELMQLAEKGELSLTEEDELTRLKAQNIELENQIELLEKQQELKEREIARNADKAYEKGTYDDKKGDDKLYAGFTQTETITTDDGNGNISTEEVETHFLQSYSSKGVGLTDSDFEVRKGQIEIGDPSTFATWKKSMEDLYAQAITNAKSTDGRDSKGWEKVAEQIKNDIEETQKFYEKERGSYLEGLQEGYDQAQEALPALKAQNEDGRYDDTIAYYENIVRDYQKQHGTLDNTVNKVFGESGLNLDKDTALDLQTSSEVINEETKKLDEQELKRIIGESGVQQLKIYSEELGMSMYDLVSTYQDINGIAGKFGPALDDALAEIRAQKEEELVTQTNEKFENIDLGDNQTITTEDIQKSGFTAEDLQNWDKILEYLDTNIVKTEGWQAALKEAKAEYEEINTLLKSNQTLATAAENYNLDLEELKAYKELLLEINPELKENGADIDAIVIANKRMEKGVKEIASNWEDFNKIMSDSNASAEDVSSILPEVNKSLQDILNLDTDDFELLPADFAQKNWKLIDDVTNGVEGAVDELRDVAGKEILMNVTGVLNTDDLNSDLAQLNDNLLAFDNRNFTVGVAIDDTNFIETCNNIISKAGMTVAQAQAYFQAMGYDAKIKEHTVTKTVTRTVEYPIIDERTGYPTGATDTMTLTEETGTTGYAIETITPSGSYGGGIGVSTTASKGSTAPKTKKSGSESKPDKMDSNKDKVDIYHDINMEIKSLSNEIEKLGKKENKLFGQQLIDNLNEQLGVLQAQTEAYKEKIELAKKEAALYRSNLASQGVNFDSQGNVTNYIAAMQGKQDYLNSLIAKYNAMSKTEQEKFKETVEQAKKDYDQFKTDMEYYENLVSDTIPDLEAQIQDAMDKQIEIQIQKFTMEVEIRLEMAEAERDWNEFKKKIIDDIDDDDILGNAMAKMLDFDSYYKNNNKGSVQVLTKQVDETLEQLRQIDETGTSSVYGDNRAKAMEDLKNYYSQLMTELENVEDLIDEIEQSYLDMIDEANEKFDDQVDKYEYINDLFESNKNVIELLKGDDAYNELGKYYQMQKENNNAELDFLRQEVDFWASKMDSEEQGSEAWKKYYENWKDATSSLNDTFERTLQNLIDEYNNTVNRVFDELNDSLTNGKGLEYVGEEWDLLKRNADQYLDTVNATYEIQKLQGKYMSAIDGSDSLYAQGKLNSLMEEQMKMLREKDKLTQYDVERANMLYDIAVKEIALKDAQQNKSQMRLRRDAQGNFSYQYVADDDAIGQAEQELADAKNSLYNLDKDAYRENLDQIYDIYVEFQEKLKELYADTTLSEEEREERKKLLIEQYEELINGIAEENTNIRLNLQQSAIDALAEYQDAVLMDQIVPGWESGVQMMADEFKTEDGKGGLVPHCQGAIDELDKATNKYAKDIEEAGRKAGLSLTNIYNGTDKAVIRVQDLVDTNEDLIEKYDEEISAIQEVQNELDTLVEKFETAREKAIEAAMAAHQYWMYVNNNIDFDKELPTPSRPSGGDPGGGIPGGGGNPNGGNPDGGGDNNENLKNKQSKPTYFAQTGKSTNGDRWFTIYDQYRKSWNGLIGISEEQKNKYVKQYGLTIMPKTSIFNTGGYTGKWTNGDKDGKLAFLHQKELVLNSEDTENILSAVDIVRSIGASMRDRISSLTSKFNNNSNIANSGMVIEQKVSIDARFEGQTESSQIETALINLVNYASQHAYDTTR